jgi:hypothetical protein
MRKVNWLRLGGFVLALIVIGAGVCFAAGYRYVDSPAGFSASGKVELTNAEEPADGPTVATIRKDAQKFFAPYIKEKGLPAAKAFYYKLSATGRINAESWQPIDHFDAQGIAVTKAINSAGDYYLYNWEVHYDRPVGSSKWTAAKSSSAIYLGNGTPGRNSIHLVAADGTDKTQAEIDAQTQREQEDYDRAQEEYNKKNEKVRPTEQPAEQPVEQSQPVEQQFENVIPQLNF